MKQPITLRIDPELLAMARRSAGEENRTLTNFIETVLKQHIESAHGASDLARLSRSGRPRERAVVQSGRGHSVRPARDRG